MDTPAAACHRRLSIAAHIRTLDADARRLLRAAIVIGFPHSVHLLFADHPNRAAILGRFTAGGGSPIGIIGCHKVNGNLRPYYHPFPEWSGVALVYRQLRYLAQQVGCCPLRSYALLPGIRDSPPSAAQSVEDLAREIEQNRIGLSRATIVLAQDDGPQLIGLDRPVWRLRLEQFLAANAIPVGLLGCRRQPAGLAHDSTATDRRPVSRSLFASVLFTQHAGIPWAVNYLDGMREVLDCFCLVAGNDLRLLPPADRTAVSQSPKTLLAALDAWAACVFTAHIVVAFDYGPDFVSAADPRRAALLPRLLTLQGIPIGLVGYTHVHNVPTARFHAFPEHAEHPWVHDCLTAVTQRLQQHLDRLTPACT